MCCPHLNCLKFLFKTSFSFSDQCSLYQPVLFVRLSCLGRTTKGGSSSPCSLGDVQSLHIVSNLFKFEDCLILSYGEWGGCSETEAVCEIKSSDQLLSAGRDLTYIDTGDF